MQEFFRTAIYSKNVPVFERLARIGLAALLVGVTLVWSVPSWVAYIAWGNAAFIAATGFIGFCPACYVGGRRLLPRRT